MSWEGEAHSSSSSSGSGMSTGCSIQQRMHRQHLAPRNRRPVSALASLEQRAAEGEHRPSKVDCYRPMGKSVRARLEHGHRRPASSPVLPEALFRPAARTAQSLLPRLSCRIVDAKDSRSTPGPYTSHHSSAPARCCSCCLSRKAHTDMGPLLTAIYPSLLTPELKKAKSSA